MTTPLAAGFFNNPANNVQGTLRAGWDNMIAVSKEQPGGAAETTLTISAGNITPTGACHAVDTEGSASTDDLANIVQTNHPEGRLLFLRAYDAARTVVCKDSAGGAGQLVLSDGDFALDDTDKYILLQRRSTAWYEVGRFHGEDRPARRNYADGDVGSIRGLWVSYVSSTQVSIAGGEIVVHDGTTARRLYADAAIAKTPTITESTNHIVYLYVDTPASGLTLAAADIEQSNTAPTWSHAKVGYYHPATTDWRFIGSVPVKSDNTIRAFGRQGDRVVYTSVGVVGNVAIPTTPTDVDISAYVPSIAGVRAILSGVFRYDTGYPGWIYMRENGTTLNMSVSNLSVFQVSDSTCVELPVDANGIFEYYADSAGGKVNIFLGGYAELR